MTASHHQLAPFVPAKPWRRCSLIPPHFAAAVLPAPFWRRFSPTYRSGVSSLLAFGDLLLDKGAHRVADGGERPAEFLPVGAFVALLPTERQVMT